MGDPATIAETQVPFSWGPFTDTPLSPSPKVSRDVMSCSAMPAGIARSAPFVAGRWETPMSLASRSTRGAPEVPGGTAVCSIIESIDAHADVPPPSTVSTIPSRSAKVPASSRCRAYTVVPGVAPTSSSRYRYPSPSRSMRARLAHSSCAMSDALIGSLVPDIRTSIASAPTTARAVVMARPDGSTTVAIPPPARSDASSGSLKAPVVETMPSASTVSGSSSTTSGTVVVVAGAVVVVAATVSVVDEAAATDVSLDEPEHDASTSVAATTAIIARMSRMTGLPPFADPSHHVTPIPRRCQLQN